MYNLQVLRFYADSTTKVTLILHLHTWLIFSIVIHHCFQHPDLSVSNTSLFIFFFPSPLTLHHGSILLHSYSYSLPHHLSLYPLFISKPVGFFYFITISCVTLGILLLSVIFICPCHFSVGLFYCQSDFVSQMEQNAREVPCSTMFLKHPLKTFSKHVLFLRIINF